jgi:hypothetical protein
VSPLTAELSDEAKAELAVEFAELKLRFPPIVFENLGGYTFMRPIQRRRPWEIR